MKEPLHFWRRLIATLIDLSLIYCMTFLLQRIAWLFVPLNPGIVFICLFPIYYFLSYILLEGRTPAKILCGLRLVSTWTATLTIKQIIVRELVCKTFIGMVVPLLLITGIFEYGRESTIPLFELLAEIAVFSIILIVSLLAFLIKRRTWWDIVSGAALRRQPMSDRRFIWRTSLATSVPMLATVWIALFPFVSGSLNIKNSYLPKYPVSRGVKKYADFIQEKKQDPVDYIFNLFERYDIVVLSERMHPEYTQYEFITKVIRDPRFIRKVGTLFTECGSISFQDTLNALLRTTFDSPDSLDLRTALLQRNSNVIWPLWDNTNLFDLLKSVNLLNAGLPDSVRINWYFTDLPVDWRRMNHQKFIAAYTDPYRDSFMARQIIARYENQLHQQQYRRKAFVIMNTRHAYGFTGNSIPGSFRKEYGNSTAGYLMRRFPGKVANVMINTVSIRYGYVFTPVQNGKKDAAFSLPGNPAAGFDFSGSPFGNDIFDAGIRFYPSVTYKDVFTGFVFYKPLQEHFEKTGFAHEFDGFEDTLLRRCGYVDNTLVHQMRRRLEGYKKDRGTIVTSEPQRYALIVNLLQSGLMPALVIVSLLFSMLSTFLGRRNSEVI